MWEFFGLQNKNQKHITRMVSSIFERMQQQHDCISLEMAGKDEEKIALN